MPSRAGQMDVQYCMDVHTSPPCADEEDANYRPYLRILARRYEIEPYQGLKFGRAWNGEFVMPKMKRGMNRTEDFEGRRR